MFVELIRDPQNRCRQNRRFLENVHAQIWRKSVGGFSAKTTVFSLFFGVFSGFGVHFSFLLGFWHTLGSMVLQMRPLARKTGQISTYYLTRTSFLENGTFRLISRRKSSRWIAGRAPL